MRLQVRREGMRVRCFTKNGHDWTDRFPAIVDADRTARRTSKRCAAGVAIAFDLIQLKGDDLRDQPLIDRKRLLAKILAGRVEPMA